MKDKIEKLIKERIKANEKLFTAKELTDIKNIDNLIKKIYILGLLDGNEKFQKSSKMDIIIA